MTKCEKVLSELKELLEKKFAEVLIEENKRHDDGVVMEPVYIQFSIDEVRTVLPCFVLTMKTAEYTEKDRILQVLKYRIDIEIIVKKDSEQWVKLERYKEALENFFNGLTCNDMTWYSCDVLGNIENRVRLEIGILNNLGTYSNHEVSGMNI